MNELAVRLRSTPPKAGRTRVIAVDGRSGSGKSTLAAELARDLNAPVVSLEDLYGGWDGLEDGVDRLVADVLAPLSEGRRALVPHYDWIDGTWKEPVPLDPLEELVVEGVGAGCARAARYISLLVWMELSEEDRKQRALERDGDIYGPHWERWAAQETAMLARERTPERADAVVKP
ncbi:hypothetical protein [Actinocorallia aurantiaca]|uniref:AAA family ATPase n=1 Tax=Actinocorallia aurantiaca TaxID=46204 RepID=A0ABP6GX44_9ACTN